MTGTVTQTTACVGVMHIKERWVFEGKLPWIKMLAVDDLRSNVKRFVEAAR